MGWFAANHIWPFLFCICLGNLGKTYTGKLFWNFKRLKNREDGFDFDDFWTKQIAALSAKIWKFFGPSNKFPRGRKLRKTFENLEKIVKMFTKAYFLYVGFLYEAVSKTPPRYLAPVTHRKKNFKRPKNHEDGSDFDDLWTKSIAWAPCSFWNIFAL